MAGRLTPLGVVGKWIVIPVALGAIGYFVVGPRVGKGVLERVKVPDKVRDILTPGQPEKPKGPSIEVDAKPVS